MQGYKRMGIMLTTLVLAGLACNFGLGGPKPPQETIPVSTEAVESLQQEVAEAMQQAAQTGTFTLELTETQVTSAMALALQQSPVAVVQNPQVYLRDGRIQLTGTAEQGGLKGPINVVIAVEVGQDCKPHFKVVSANFGLLPLPEEVLNSFMPLAEQALSDLIASSEGGGAPLCLQSVVIADGKMTISGQKQ